MLSEYSKFYLFYTTIYMNDSRLFAPFNIGAVRFLTSCFTSALLNSLELLWGTRLQEWDFK